MASDREGLATAVPWADRPWALYVVWVNYHCADEIARSWAAVAAQAAAATTAVALTPLCVNNSPDDATVATIADRGMTVLSSGGNVGFGRACNVAIRWVADRDRGATVWLLNPDAEPAPGCLDALVRVLGARSDWALCGTTVVTPAGGIWQTGGRWQARSGRIEPRRDRLPLDSDDRDRLYETPWVSGCSLLINLAQFRDEIPQFDPDFFLYYEDFDLCLRYGRAGYRIQWLPAAIAIHRPSSIIGRTPTQRIRWALMGYWLALEKHAPRSVLVYRLLRAAIATVAAIPRNRPAARAKGQALRDYGQGWWSRHHRDR